MKRTVLFLTFTGLLLLASMPLAKGRDSPASLDAGYDLSWWTVDGGGGVSTGSRYTLIGSAGQPDAGSLNDGAYTLAGGFWGEGAAVHLPLAAYLPYASRLARSPNPIVEEVPNARITAEDPVVQTGRLDPWVVSEAPETPLDGKDDGAYALMKETKWSLIPPAELGPGESHELTVSFDEPVLLLAKAEWVGSLDPVEMRVTKDGVTLTSGETYSLPPDLGVIVCSVEINTAGSATVSVLNPTGIPVSVQIAVGTLALSFRENASSFGR